jgi:hypothetical protein
MDRPVMDRLGQGDVASVHRGQHPLQVAPGLGMPGLDLVGRGRVIRVALDDQVVQGGGERPAGLVKAAPQVA